MLLRRRYRLFTVCAVVMVVMLYRVFQNSWGESMRLADIPPTTKPLEDALANVEGRPPPLPQSPSGEDETNKKPAADDMNGLYGTTAGEESKGVKMPDPKGQENDKLGSDRPEDTAGSSEATLHDPMDEPTYLDRPSRLMNGEDVLVQAKNPPKDNQKTNNQLPEGSDQIHWTKPEEHFPLPEGSINSLPAGKPKTIPKIQFDFATESEETKSKRVRRQERVKAELERAWRGYKTYAWMHDELSPVSNKYRDPFCGWAATLVDSLDTLWIADMKQDFDEAAKAVANIDFTYTPRIDIPVFETTIRYLGGLLAAFDVSGGHEGDYPILLEKATELGEILMGVFDTPNRMPVLYYRWQPEYASQPHRAGIVGVAELATLSMEFTRLAQLTGKQKYYDAIDRITDALVKMQEAGTSIPGLFSEHIDASGCNRTAATVRNSLSQEAQAQMDSPGLEEAPTGYSPGAQEDSTSPQKQTQLHHEAVSATENEAAGQDKHLQRRGVTEDVEADPEASPLARKDYPDVPQHSGRTPPFAADGSTAQWDCEPQGLVSGDYGFESYSMGGAQDSAYEYFSKEYLLLGGLEPKYQKLHEDTIDAINEWMLYRPMIKDEGWDILFPAKVETRGNPEKDLLPTFEMTHLTCFIGGMYGLGGKIFGREKDIETAKKLTDGCVWAYQSTPSGIMPEWSHLVPCPTLNECEFNETLWWEHLDPYMEQREENIKIWEAAEAGKTESGTTGETGTTGVQKPQEFTTTETTEEPARPDTYRSKDEDRRVDAGAAAHDPDADVRAGYKLAKRASIPPPPSEELPLEDDEAGSALPNSLKDKLNPNNESPKDVEGTLNAQKQIVTSGGITSEGDASEDAASDGISFDGDESEENVEMLPNIPGVPWQAPQVTSKPLTHEEFVKQKLASEPIPPGYSNIGTASYILRPEAIESVWYMYRITGDTTWMDKGWAMFEATIRATRTELANSAIDNVMSKSPQLKDEMESFWIAETLKYYYLLFSEPDVISLDEWVLNTEAHPFRRPT